MLDRFTAHTLRGSATPAPQAPTKPVPFDMKEWRKRWGAFMGPAAGKRIREACEKYDRLHGK